MIFTFARGIISTLHGAVSTGLDVLTGIAPKPRDTMNQEQAEKITVREEREKRADQRAIEREARRRFEEKVPLLKRSRGRSYRR